MKAGRRRADKEMLREWGCEAERRPKARQPREEKGERAVNNCQRRRGRLRGKLLSKVF